MRLPGADLGDLQDRYARATGIEIDHDRIRYYRAAVDYRCAVTTSLAVSRGGGARGWAPYLLVTERYVLGLADRLSGLLGVVENVAVPEVSPTARTPSYDHLLDGIRAAVRDIDDVDAREGHAQPADPRALPARLRRDRRRHRSARPRRSRRDARRRRARRRAVRRGRRAGGNGRRRAHRSATCSAAPSASASSGRPCSTDRVADQHPTCVSCGAHTPFADAGSLWARVTREEVVGEDDGEREAGRVEDDGTVCTRWCTPTPAAASAGSAPLTSSTTSPSERQRARSYAAFHTWTLSSADDGIG